MLVQGKNGIVTGAAGGIGRASAIAFAREGANVVIGDLKARLEDLEETARMVKEAGGEARVVAMDVTSLADQERAVAIVLEEFGTLDFAHNNAGIELQKTVLETTEEEWDRVHDVNLKGVFLGVKAQLPAMIANGGGSIVNTASAAGILGLPGYSGYASSKHGVVGLTRSVAVEAADTGVRVNAVCPASIATPMLLSLPAEEQATLLSGQAIKRLGDPDEVAQAVVWLASERASFITGISLPVDAGYSAF